MQGGAGRHAELAGELIKWWEGLWQRGMTSRVVLVAVPPGWGRTTGLDRLAEAAGGDDAPVTLVVRINGRELPGETGLQAAALRECLAGAAVPHRVAELLGMDRLGGSVQTGIGIGALFVSGPAAGVAFLLAGLAVGAAGKAWDRTSAGQDGVVARAARAVAAVSARVPVVVIVDDADCLDEGVALTMIENLAARQDGHVLVVAAVDPDGSLRQALRSRSRTALTLGLVHVAHADPDMGFGARSDLARLLCPGLPEAAVRRIARGTVTFKDVFANAAAPRLAEISAADDEAKIVAAVDTVLAAQPGERAPSAEAVVIAWAGGLLHARQAARALAVLGVQHPADGDREVLRWEGLERLVDPASPPLARRVAALAVAERRMLAAALLEEALAIAADPGCGLLDRVAAAQAAHRVRRDVAGTDLLPRVQRELAAGLEELGEPAAARDIAVTALAEWPPGGRQEDRDWLAAAALRLSRLVPQESLPPEAATLIGEAVRSGAATGLEARIWATIPLLDDPGQREAALAMAEQAAADLDARTGVLGDAGTKWRLLLAFHVGRAGHPAMTAQILAPLLNSGDPGTEDAAHAVLQAADGPRADTRLQNSILEAELAALPADADDDQLRIHHVLAANYRTLGQSRQDLTHDQHELDLRNRIQGPDHRDTLRARNNVAYATAHCGNAAEGLRLSQALLPDQTRVLGPDDPDTLTTRNNIASWMGECGDAAAALRLFQALLPDRTRVLGPDHPDTLRTRNNIASLTGQCGDAAEGVRLSQALLPDQTRVLGPDHPETLATQNNIASLTGECGDAAGALRLFEALLPDLTRVLGPDHPHTLATRNNIASLTGRCGDAAGALRLFEALLPDLTRVLGPDHPDTLSTRNSIALWTGWCGNAAEALRLLQALLPDRTRVLGPDHPDTLSMRNNIAFWTGQCGDAAGALRLFRALLPDKTRVLGPDHPDTLRARNNIAYATAHCGNTAGALRLFRALLPDQTRVLGPDHPETLNTRNILRTGLRLRIVKLEEKVR